MTQSSSSNTSFPLLQKYGAFLGENYLLEASKEYLKALMGSKISILSLLTELSEEQLMENSKQLLKEYFQQLSQGRALEQAKDAILLWQSGKHPLVPKEK